VTDGPDRDAAHGLWDSGRVEGSQNLDVGYRGLPLREGSRFWWWVRVWGADGAASPWSEAAAFESGLVGRRDVGSVWIGPSENTFADPLPLMGDWIAPPVVGASGDDEGALTGVIDLPDGYPRCFGMCWISADRACTVELNGHLLENPQPLATDRSVAIGLPWMHLKKGRNVLAVRGPAAALGRGVSFLARIHEAASGKHFLRSGPDWACWGSPVQLLGGRPPASQPADNGPRRAVEMKRTFRVDAAYLYELYDLGEDEGETQNLAGDMPEKVAELDALITKHLEDTGVPVPPANRNFNPTAYNPIMGDGVKPPPPPAPKPVAGWVPSGNTRLAVDGGHLVVTGATKDPWFSTRELPGATGPLVLKLRMKRATTGDAQVFWAAPAKKAFTGAQSVSFNPEPGDGWHEYAVELPTTGKTNGLRIDPARSPGVSTIDWIEVVAPGGDVMKRWDF